MTRKGDWFQTYTGRKFYPFDPRPDEVDIVDIAHSLSLQCRFNGHTNHFYSVAQHSIHVCYVFRKLVEGTSVRESRQAHICALLHDAAEAYVGDLIRPIKICIPSFEEMEEKIWSAILEHFGLVEVWEYFLLGPLVKKADNILLMTERRDLLPEGLGRDLAWPEDYEGIRPDSEMTITPCTAEKAQTWFLQLFNSLQWTQEIDDAS